MAMAALMLLPTVAGVCWRGVWQYRYTSVGFQLLYYVRVNTHMLVCMYKFPIVLARNEPSQSCSWQTEKSAPPFDSATASGIEVLTLIANRHYSSAYLYRMCKMKCVRFGRFRVRSVQLHNDVIDEFSHTLRYLRTFVCTHRSYGNKVPR